MKRETTLIKEEYTRMPTKNELETKRRPEKIYKRYDHLLEERYELKRKLTQFDYSDCQMVYSKDCIDDQKFRELVDMWLAKVRRDTALLRSLDQLEITVFTEALENQTKQDTVTFGSEKLLRDLFVEGRAVSGTAKRDAAQVDISNLQPSFRNQILYFLKNGKLDPTVLTLIHELVHRADLRKNQLADGILTEAHAYFNGLAECEETNSFAKITTLLTLPEDEGGLYEYDCGKVIEALNSIGGLYALGVDESEITTLIAHSRYSAKLKKYIPINNRLEALKREYKIDELDTEALGDIFRLHATNQRLKAQLFLYQTINEYVPQSRLREHRIQTLREEIVIPTYWQNEVEIFPPKELKQNVILPIDSEFPYDPGETRTGIFFGFSQKNGKEPTFGLGKWVSEGKRTEVQLSEDPKEVEGYIIRISGLASKIGIKSKRRLLMDYFDPKILTQEPVAKKILQAIISKEEATMILHEWMPNVIGSFRLIQEGIQKLESQLQSGSLSTKDQTLFKEYTRYVGLFENLYEVFDITPSEI